MPFSAFVALSAFSEENAMALLGPYLESGKAIPFTVKRGNERIEITVKPDPR